ncbi:TolC family protein [Hyphomonas sp. L-53-1-40]|uniref:TolC family protein n=1 Tax=Hyphomonas sp. L-53-1-40 TaxID=1207058 RepID=UPI000A8CBC27|nr:TolC family protein [Hyphomonas sp. L-53-1-40]
MKIGRACVAILPAILIAGLSNAQTVDDAISAALLESPALDRTEAGIKAAREGVRQARAAYLPEVTFSASASTARRDARLRESSDFSETSEPTSVTIRASQPLYTNGLRQVAQQQATNTVRARRHEQEATRLDVALQVVEAMVQLDLARKSASLDRTLQSLLRDQVRAEEERYRLETGTQTNVVQARARLAAAEAAITASDMGVQQAEIRLALLTGYPVDMLAPMITASAELPPSLDDALFLARENSPNIALARSSYTAARLGAVTAARKYGPQINLSAEASTARTPSPAIEQDDDIRATLTFSMPLFNGGRSSSERRQAYAERRASAADVRKAGQDLQRHVTDTWVRLASAKSRLTALQVRLDAAGEALKGVRQGQQAGLWTVTDILDAMEERVEAERALEQARAEHILSAYELSITCGLYILPR